MVTIQSYKSCFVKGQGLNVTYDMILTIIYINFRIPQIEEAIADLGDLPAVREEEISEEKAFLKKIVQFLLGLHINKIRHAECEGCIRNYPSQRDHACLMDDIDYQIDKYFDTALVGLCREIVAAAFAFHGRRLPEMDWKAYKIANSNDLHKGLGEIVNPVFENVDSQPLNNFYNAMKLYIA